MKDTIIQIRVEKDASGNYWGNSLDKKIIVTAEGNTMEDLKKNISEAFEFAVEDLANAEDYADVTFEYQMEIASFFNLIPEIKISKLADKAHINASLMRQYASGKTYVSENRLKDIQKTVHELGQELLSVNF